MEPEPSPAAALLSSPIPSLADDPEPEMLLERIEVAVGVEELQTVEDAARGDQAIDRLADRDAALAQRDVVRGGGQRDGGARHIDEGKAQHQSLGRLEVRLAGIALKHLGEREVADDE